MIDTALYFLYKVALRNPENQFAKAIYNRFKNAGDKVDQDSLKGLLDIPFDDNTILEKSNPVIIEKKKDYRFLHLYLKAFRKFPNLPEKEYFGISFCNLKGKTKVPESTLLQGGNGTGKTSIFGAMEYLFTGRMSAAYKLGFDTKEKLADYLHHAAVNIDKIDINVQTQSLPFHLKSDSPLQKDILRLCLLPFFCSEYDVDKVIKDGIDKFVYEQMGYTLVRNIIIKIEEDIKDATQQYEAIEKNSKSIDSLIENLDKEYAICKSLKSTVLSFAVKLRSVSKPKKDLETLKEGLTGRYIPKTDNNHSSDVKWFTVENLENEKKLILKTLGNKAFSHFMEQLYSNTLEFLHAEPEQTDDIPLDPLKSKKDNEAKVLEDINVARNCFLQIIDKILESGSDKLSDLATWVEQYDAFLENKEKDLQLAQNRKESANKVIRIFENKKIFEEFLSELKSEVYGKIKSLTSGACDLVNEVLELFLMKDEQMSLSFNEQEGTFSMIVIFHCEDGREVLFTPEKYLNTFRYKLFCMTLKMAIAFAMKKFYEINFPIVLDDIFYSSDFVHRGMVRNYFWLLFDKHKSLFPGETLQIIFLTHDDLVIEAAHRGICDVTCGEFVNRQVMFDYRESGKPKKIKAPVIDDEGQPVTVKIKMNNLAFAIV